MLKKLFDDYDLPIERILMKEHKRLNLESQELVVLLALFSIYKKRKTFSLNAISKRVSFSLNDIGQSIESLLKKEFLEIILEKKDEREREVFDLEKTFFKVEALWKLDEQEKIKSIEQSYIAQTIDLFEQGLGRALMSFELETIREWYVNPSYTHQHILDAVKSSEPRFSVKFVERLLNQPKVETVDIDQDIDQALDEIYKNIR